ncbi:FliC/FljB family flagellin [Halomonas salifodinae]|uniref:FliC/FljB family flagellin n=1 Tax=Halomonas salifodinae TaxID=438745 RepID=UPI0033A323CD
MSVINTNITSMIGQSNLNKSQNALQTSMERLSSGLRINSAKDDAAGQAIANRMTAQITGLQQASRNANDGISIAQTAEGSLNQINDNVQRIRELSVQAANGTNSQSDLNSIQDEINQRLNEIDRISEETDFNGTKVLDAGVGPMTIQVGANDGETIEIALTAINRDTLGLEGFRVADADITAGAVSGTEVTELPGTVALSASGFADPAADTDSAGEWGDFIESAGGSIYAEYTGGTATSGGGTVTSAGNGFYEVTISVGGSLTVATTVEGTDPTGTVVTEAEGGPGTPVTVDGDGELRAYNGTESGAPEYVVAVASAGGTESFFEANFSAGGTTVTAGAELSTEGRTLDPLEQLDDALQTIDSLRSELGAVQNRFEDAITNLDTNATNLSAARSRIEDADYAVEVANMTRAQILQQAGTSVLAQANQIPQNVLSLLG